MRADRTCAGHGVQQPSPGNFLQHRIRGDVVLELSSGEDHGSEGAVPLINAIGIMEKNEAARSPVVVEI
jgi:hypothetical protein